MTILTILGVLGNHFIQRSKRDREIKIANRAVQPAFAPTAELLPEILECARSDVRG